MTDRADYEGGCLCGAIRYAVRGDPVSTNLCYCTQCRKQTGSVMPAFVSFRREQLSLRQGSPRDFSSSDRAIRQFCGCCGSALFWRSSEDDIVDVFLGTFDAPAEVRAPDFSIWNQHRLGWVKNPDGTRAFLGARSDA